MSTPVPFPEAFKRAQWALRVISAIRLLSEDEVNALRQIVAEHEQAIQDRDDARNLAAEVAQGVTHSPDCTPEMLCIRCKLDEVFPCNR